MKYSELKPKPNDLFRRTVWESGVVGTLLETGEIIWYHVGACSLPPPPEEEFEKDGWIIVEEYGRDIGFRWS